MAAVPPVWGLWSETVASQCQGRVPQPLRPGPLGEAAVSVGWTDTFLGARYRRLAPASRQEEAVVSIGRSLLVIIWHLLADPGPRFHELGNDYYDRHVTPTRGDRYLSRPPQQDVLSLSQIFGGQQL